MTAVGLGGHARATLVTRPRVPEIKKDQLVYSFLVQISSKLDEYMVWMKHTLEKADIVPLEWWHCK